MSERRSDTRRLLSLEQPWENGPRTPTPNTTGVPEWVTSGYNDDPRGLAIAVGQWREPKTTPADRAAVRAMPAFRPEVDGFRCVGYGCGNQLLFPQPNTFCYWCRGRVHP